MSRDRRRDGCLVATLTLTVHSLLLFLVDLPWLHPGPCRPRSAPLQTLQHPVPRHPSSPPALSTSPIPPRDKSMRISSNGSMPRSVTPEKLDPALPLSFVYMENTDGPVHYPVNGACEQSAESEGTARAGRIRPLAIDLLGPSGRRRARSSGRRGGRCETAARGDRIQSRMDPERAVRQPNVPTQLGGLVTSAEARHCVCQAGKG
jgi:hypothetical protein